MSPARLLDRRPHDPLDFEGTVELLRIESDALRGNALGDRHVRELPIYVPPGTREGDALPLVFVLAGFTGRGQAFLKTDPWGPGLLSKIDRAMAAGSIPPAVLVMPDCFTKLGGSQYVNSSAVGAYEDHVADELVPLACAELPVAEDRRAVVGKSSGGFGALRLAMVRPGLFSACGSISGDCGFENTFPGEFLACLRGLVAYDMDPARFLDAFYQEPDLSGDGHAIINTLAMAACYSPNPDSPLGFDLPFDLATGELVPEVWERWLDFDPLRTVERHADALGGLRYLHVECGLTDEFHIQWGTRRLARALTRLDVTHVHEEHPGGHFRTDGRYLELLPRLIRALG